MPKFLLNRWHGLHMVISLAFSILLIGLLALHHWVYGAVGLIIFSGITYFIFQSEKAFRRDLTDYIATLNHRVKKAGNEVIHQLPIGMLLYDEELNIEWHNPFVSQMLQQEGLIGSPIGERIPGLKAFKQQEAPLEVSIKDKVYQVMVKPGERLLYFTEITELKKLKTRYEEERVVYGIVHIDNLDEVAQGLDDQNRSMLLANVTREITEWANKYKIYLRRFTADKFFVVMDQKSLKSLENNRFDIIDVVRDMTQDNKIPLTLSIGIGAGSTSLVELGNMAQTSLDIALGRGGDQAAVKIGQRLTFYGGKSNAVEKRTRVRARVISHALRDLIRESDKVIILGHKEPDLDAIGAAIGVLKAVQVNGKEGYIVLDEVNPSISRLMEVVNTHEKLKESFVTPEQALQISNSRSLLIVVDTHKPSMVIEPKLLQTINQIVVVDHHRRGEEFIKEPTLLYMEPYASSTCELVTELLQYQTERLSLDVIEATSLLAGIVVDTKSFALRTGARTFEAASFLRRYGADSTLVQRFLKEDLSMYVQRSEMIKNTEVLLEGIAIAIGEEDKTYPQLIIAQAADTLLNMSDVLASFVVAKRTDGFVAISARSLGDINVQVIMERLGGGGHLTNAAVQFEDKTLEEAAESLKKVLEEIDQEGGLFS
jgi:c-di-AMP phosphodiesterase-like protein